MTSNTANPAVLAATRAQAIVEECLDQGVSFRLEAGAGAGKTYSLVESLRKVIDKRGVELLRDSRKVACITYTEVARDEIAQKIAMHPAVVVDTVHAFCWRFIGQFQRAILSLLHTMEDKKDKIAAGGGLEGKFVDYKLGFFKVEDRTVSLGHDDVPRIMALLCQSQKIRNILRQQYPIIFIDEYQDTDRLFMDALEEQFFKTGAKPLIGLFGDHWQTIYRSDYDLTKYSVKSIDKGANFRSVPQIVNVLNNLRPDLTQSVNDVNASGEARFFHTNAYTGEREKGAHSKLDLPPDVGLKLLHDIRQKLAGDGWNFSPEHTKILMLTHNSIAARQGYPGISAVFDRSEAFAKKEDPTIEFLIDVFIPALKAYGGKQYGEMFKLIGDDFVVAKHSDKVACREGMEKLVELTSHGTVGDVLDFLNTYPYIRLPEKVRRREVELAAFGAEPIPMEARASARQRQLREIPFAEIKHLAQYIDGNTPFATQHSVKGAQFENVLVVLGGGWSHYNWPSFFELLSTQALTDKNRKGYYRARNLFYVSVSRPKRRLAVIATQVLSPDALRGAIGLFGEDNIVPWIF